MKPRFLIAIAAALAMLEGYDVASYGVTVPTLLKEPSLGIDPARAGLFGSLTAFGMLIGAALAGASVRRVGARRLILGASLTFSLGMALCAAAPVANAFGGGRLLVGFGLGVIMPTLLAYVAELSPVERRQRNIGVVMAGYAGGGLSAPLLGAALLPAISYRWIYIIGILPLAIVFPIAFRQLPESRVAPPKKGEHRLLGLAPLFAPGLRLPTLLFWGMSVCGLFLVFGISTWLPKIMVASGYALGSALLQTAAMWLGAGVGTTVGGRIADRTSPKLVVITSFLLGTMSLIGMSLRPNIVVLFVLMFVSGIGFVGSQTLVNGFIVSRYPADLRGSGLAWALSAGRPGAIVGPVVGAVVLTSQLGVAWNFYVFAIVGAVGALLALLVPVPAEKEVLA